MRTITDPSRAGSHQIPAERSRHHELPRSHAVEPTTMPSMHKYPRTHHLEGSRLQPGDEDLSSVPLRVLEGRDVVLEEKVDGGNAGISFDEEGRLYLQSRGHFLDGGPRERAKEYLRKGTSFVWNATNISRQMRERAIGLFAAYNARVRIVYVEAPASALWRQNRDREDAVPASAIRAMMNRWEVPDLTEAHEVVWMHE
jgi:hypothetical protein